MNRIDNLENRTESMIILKLKHKHSSIICWLFCQERYGCSRI